MTLEEKERIAVLAEPGLPYRLIAQELGRHAHRAALSRQWWQRGGVLALASQSEAPPLYVPIVGAAWGVLLWVVAGRHMVRDFRGEIHQMAEKRARSRIVRGLGGSGDVDAEFEQLWRIRWLVPVIAVLYVLGVVWAFVLALMH